LFKARSGAHTSEDMTCALCEYSREADGKFFCKGKAVSPVYCCGKFLFDPLKKEGKHYSTEEKAGSIEFIPIDD